MTINDLPKLLREVQQSHFWGSIQLDFHDGELVLIRRTETIKPRMENTRDEYRSR